MKTCNGVTSTIMLLVACTAGGPAHSAGIDGQAMAAESMKRKKELVDVTVQELNRVATALKHFYIENSGSWPAQLSSITSHYSGAFTTPVGTITGTQTTMGFQLFIDTNNLDQTTKSALQTELAKNHGVLSGGRVVMDVDVPQAAAIARTALSRFSDPSGTGELNTMYADLLMNGNNIQGLGELSATNVIANSATIGDLSSTQITADAATITTAVVTQANLTNANIDNALIDTATIDTATVDLAILSTINGNVATFNTATIDTASITSATVDGLTTNTISAVRADLQEASIANTLTVNGAAIFGDTVNMASNLHIGGHLYSNGALVVDSLGKLYYQGQDLDTRFLGISDTALNAEMLGGVNAANFARKDMTNTFAAHQVFAGGITVGGSGIQTNNLDVSGNTYTNDMYLKSRQVWMSSVVDKANSAYSRIGVLEEKFNSGGSGNSMGRWVQTNYQVSKATTHPFEGMHYTSFRLPKGSCVKGLKLINSKSHGNPYLGLTEFRQYTCQ